MTKPLRTPDIIELRALCAAIDLGSLGRAARLLLVSQPALSKRLRSLEALAGVPLLIRSSTGVTPTPEGAKLYSEARKLLAQAEVIEALMTGMTLSDLPVRVASGHTIAEFLLSDLLVKYEEQVADRHVNIEMVVANSSAVCNMVRDGRAEIGLAAYEADMQPDLRAWRLWDDEIVVAIAHSHPWVDLDVIPLETFLKTSFVVRDPGADARHTVERELHQRGYEMAPPLAEVGNTRAAHDTALAHGAPLMLPRLAAAEVTDMVIRPVESLQFSRTLALVLAGDSSALRPAAASLARYLQASANRILT